MLGVLLALLPNLLDIEQRIICFPLIFLTCCTIQAARTAVQRVHKQFPVAPLCNLFCMLFEVVVNMLLAFYLTDIDILTQEPVHILF